MSRMAFSITAPRPTALRAVNYSPAADRLMRRGHSTEATPLRKLVSVFAPSYGNVFTRRDCEEGSGVKLLSQVDIFAAEPIGRTIRRDSMPFALQHVVALGDILLCGAGQVGETTLFGRGIIADARLAGGYVDGHAVQLRFAEPFSDLACYVYAFLISPTGLQLIRSTAYGTSVPGVRTDLLGELPVPRAEANLLKRVAAEVRRTVHKRELFAAKLSSARASIEALDEMQRARAACATRRVRVGLHAPPLRTLSAWNHVSTGAALPLLQDAWNARVGDVVPADGIFNGLRFARIECEPPYGIELLSQRDVFLLRPVPQRVAHPGFPDRVLFPPEHSLVVGGAGTLGEGEIFGRVVYVSEGLRRYAITEHMLRIQPRLEHVALSYAFLSTLVGRRLLRSTAVGTKILSMRPDLLRALPFPDVDATTSAQVAAHLQEAMRARDAAERAEAEAIRLVETEVIPAWLS
jgi:hypothetical protein